MADALVDIGKALLENYAKDMWDQVNGNEYGDAEKSTQAILSAIKDAKQGIIHELSAVMLTNELSQQTTHIETWTEELAYCFLAKHENKKGADDDLARKEVELENGTDGIAYVLNRMDSILRQTTTIGNVGLIKLGCIRLDQDLADPKQMDKDMCWYILEMNKFLAAAVRWQTAGLALRLFTARGDQDRRDRYMKAWRANIDAQLEYTRESYHPMIRSFKFSFWDKIPESRLWRLRVPKAPDWYFIKHSDRWLTINTLYNSLSLTDHPPSNPNSDPTFHFSFSPPFDQPNPQTQSSGQWSNLQTPSLPGQTVWGAYVEEISGRTVVSHWKWKLAVDMPAPKYERRRFKLCPVDKEGRGFKMLLEGRNPSATAGDGFLFDQVFEADHVEGTGWL